MIKIWHVGSLFIYDLFYYIVNILQIVELDEMDV